MDPTTPVEKRLTARLLACPGRSRPLPMTLRYSRDDPIVVSIVMHCGTRIGDVTYALSRDMLDEGTRGRSGTGSVRVLPADPLWTLIELDDGRRYAALVVPTRHVRHFLDRAYALVPSGTEADHLDIDGLVTELLDQG
jgi:hypothetical protein